MTDDVIARARRTTGRRLLTLAASVAVVCALGGAAVIVLRGAGQPQPAVGGPAVSGPAAAPPAGSPSAGLPADLGFADVAGVSVPVSRQGGPQHSAAGLARGFSHDRGGAVLAAVHILLRLSPPLGPQVFDATLRTQVAGPDAPALRLHVAAQYEQLRDGAGSTYGQPTGRLYAQLRGYRLEQYSAEQATVRLLIAADDGRGGTALTASIAQLRWAGGDWSLLAPPGGRFDATVTAVPTADAARFLPFLAGR